MRTVFYTPDAGAPQQLLKILGRRERQVVRLVACGLLNKEIAARLGLRERTVRAYVARLFAGLEVRNRVQLTRWLLAHPSALDGDAVAPGFPAAPCGSPGCCDLTI